MGRQKGSLEIVAMNPTFGFYRGKTVLVTGHSGFKGTWLCHWLRLLGARVIGFSLPLSQENRFFAESHPELVSLHGDVRDQAALDRVIREHQPQLVFHLAAQALVGRSYEDPVGNFATNVLGTVHLLEAVRRNPAVKACVNITSDKCYHNHEWPWGYREIDPLGGKDPYSASKACAELVTQAYRASFFAEGTGIASARAGNVIGGGDWSAGRIIPDIVRALEAGQPVLLRRPAATRPWQHVLEPLHGYLILARRLFEDPAAFAGPWNFGPLQPTSPTVRELTEGFLKHWGSGSLEIAAEARTFAEAHQLRLDSSKAHALLHWQPLLSMTERLEWTVAWYRAYRDNRSGAVHNDQIAAYMERCR